MDSPIETIETYNSGVWVIKMGVLAVVGAMSMLLFHAVKNLARVGRPIGAPYASDSLYFYQRDPEDGETLNGPQSRNS